MKESGPPTEKERREWLKTEYKLGTNSAWWIAKHAEGRETETDTAEACLKAADKYVEAMFTGAKAGLRPNLRSLAETGFRFRRGCEGLSLQDYRSALSPSFRVAIRTGQSQAGVYGGCR